MLARIFSLVLVMAIITGGCTSRNPLPMATKLPTAVVADITATPEPSQTVKPAPASATPSPSSTATITPTASPTAGPSASGPDDYPPGTNPLTGLPVRDPESLNLPPAMISVTNSPVTARPQMGLSSAAWVFELWIGEGVTRFFSVFYGDLPSQGLNGEEPSIGPIRSGRLPYEPLRELYHGFVMMAFASKWVMPNLDYYTNVINENLLTDINGAHVHISQVEQLQKEYQKKLGTPRLSGLRFDPAPPPGGKKAERIFMPWSWLSQVWWRYDSTQGAYQRWQDREDGKTFVQATDRLTGKPLDFENVVVLFADHTAYRPEMISVNFMYIKKLPALVFRDGQMYPVYWTTASDTYERTTGRLRPIRFIDANGQPFPLKPGHTWVAIMTTGSPYYETVDSQDFTWLATKTAPGSGIWTVRFAVPEVNSTIPTPAGLKH